jgi:hypothetical protein
MSPRRRKRVPPEQKATPISGGRRVSFMAL